MQYYARSFQLRKRDERYLATSRGAQTLLASCSCILPYATHKLIRESWHHAFLARDDRLLNESWTSRGRESTSLRNFAEKSLETARLKGEPPKIAWPLPAKTCFSSETQPHPLMNAQRRLTSLAVSGHRRRFSLLPTTLDGIPVEACVRAEDCIGRAISERGPDWPERSAESPLTRQAEVVAITALSSSPVWPLASYPLPRPHHAGLCDAQFPALRHPICV